MIKRPNAVDAQYCLLWVCLQEGSCKMDKAVCAAPRRQAEVRWACRLSKSVSELPRQRLGDEATKRVAGSHAPYAAVTFE